MTSVRVGGGSSVSQVGTLRPVGTYAGTFDPSVGLPTSGTGKNGAILKGDYWKASGTGTIAGLIPFTDFVVDDLLYAEINNAVNASDFFGNKGQGNTRVISTSTTSSLTPDPNTYDLFEVKSLASAITIENPATAPSNGTAFVVRISDNGTNRAISYGNKYRSFGSPTTTTANKTIYIPVVYDSVSDTYDVLGYREEA